MLKIVHVLTGVLALLLSFVPSLRGDLPLLLQPAALCLLMIGLLNIQFIPSTTANTDPRTRPVLLGVSALLVLAAAVQALILLLPLEQIAGQPATLASLLLVFVAVLLHLAATRTQRQPQRERPRQQRAPAASVSGAGRETGTVKWFNTSKGFGFISRDSGDDVFVHFRAIRGEGHRVLTEGQRVEFTIMLRDKGLQAEDVVTL